MSDAPLYMKISGIWMYQKLGKFMCVELSLQCIVENMLSNILSHFNTNSEELKVFINQSDIMFTKNLLQIWFVQISCWVFVKYLQELTFGLVAKTMSSVWEVVGSKSGWNSLLILKKKVCEIPIFDNLVLNVLRIEFGMKRKFL